jgi:hypothetical protein
MDAVRCDGMSVVVEERFSMNSERVFRRSDGWYFRIRGNSSIGPYVNFREASAALERYIVSCRRQSELSFAWPRWLHVKSLLRRLGRNPETATARPRQI